MEINQAPKTTEQISDFRFPSIDGWRAVSIFFVLIQHSVGIQGWPRMFQNFLFSAIGGVGVRFFFVISGFLITWLLVKEVSKYGRICIKSFYVRRALRILPVFCLYLFIVGLLQYFNEFDLTSQEYLIAGTFMGDFWEINTPLSHLWSLGVEEKFYLFWPVIFILFFRINLKNLIVILLALIILSPILRGIVDSYQLDQQFMIFNYHSFLIILDGLAIGCLGAIIWSKYQIEISMILIKYKYLLFATGCALIAFPAVFWLIPFLKDLKPLQDTLQCSGFLILLLQSIALPAFFIYKILNLRIVAHLGIISYSIYIWMGIAELPIIPIRFLTEFPGWIIVVILFAEISYNLIEAPLMKKKKTILDWFKLSK